MPREQNPSEGDQKHAANTIQVVFLSASFGLKTVIMFVNNLYFVLSLQLAISYPGYQRQLAC